jgi:hypothetical protein
VEDDDRPGHPVKMKTDESMEKLRKPMRTDCRWRRAFHSGGAEYGQRNDQTNFNNKLFRERIVCQNDPKEPANF